MLGRVVELITPALRRPGAVLVDATLGLGGHTRAVLEAMPQSRVIGLDRDPSALAATRHGLGPLAERVTFVHTVYDRLADVLEDEGLEQVDALLFDLGVSSMQLDERERGFSYAYDAPLDMRMDPTAGPSAADVLASAGADEIARILREYGEERFARRIATAIVERRATRPVTSSADLVELIRDAIPAAARRTGGHPAKRTFQALRIEVNQELPGLGRTLPQAVAATAVGGRLVVMSYHSLEDRMVKRELARHTQIAQLPPGLPVVPEHLQPPLRPLTRGAEKATQAEIDVNPRARSVRLRAAERVRQEP